MIGILGGTFDPVHFGHLRMAQELLEALDLSEVRFIPAGTPPHKDIPATPAKHRAEMVRLAIADNPEFVLDERELNRSGASYTIDTLLSLREETGMDTAICLLMGSDAMSSLPTWHRWQELLDYCHIVVAHRPDTGHDLIAIPAQYEKSATTDIKDLASKPAGYILMQHIPLLDISATGIRQDLEHGFIPRYLTPEAVIQYIRAHQLYV